MTEPAPPQPDVPDYATPDSATPDPAMPDYKGAPLDADRGPGLGCFWTQVVLLLTLLVLTPLSVLWAWPSMVSAALLIISLVLLFFVGQTMIFLLRLVAADRRTRRRPLREGARRTVGQLEDESSEAHVTPKWIGDRLRILRSPETIAAGYADRTGVSYGWTAQFVTSVEVIGPGQSDSAVNVAFDDGTSAWFDPALVTSVEGTVSELSPPSDEDHA